MTWASFVFLQSFPVRLKSSNSLFQFTEAPGRKSGFRPTTIMVCLSRSLWNRVSITNRHFVLACSLVLSLGLMRRIWFCMTRGKPRRQQEAPPKPLTGAQSCHLPVRFARISVLSHIIWYDSRMRLLSFFCLHPMCLSECAAFVAMKLNRTLVTPCVDPNGGLKEHWVGAT